MNAPTVINAPTGIVHSTDAMYVDITVPTNTIGYYYIILNCNGTSLKLVFYIVNNHIRYSFRELVLDQLTKNLLYLTNTANNAVKNIADPITTITLTVQDPVDDSTQLFATFKVFRMAEPDNQKTTIPAAGTRRLMLDGKNVVYREAMNSVPFARMESMTGVTIGYNGFFPVFSNYNKGVNRVAKTTVASNKTIIGLMPVTPLATYQLSVVATLYNNTPYPANTDSIVKLYDSQLNHLEDKPLHIFDEGVQTSGRLTEYLIITNTEAAFCEIELVDNTMTLSQIFFAESPSTESMFDATFDSSFAGSTQELSYSDNPLVAIYGGNYTGIGYVIDMTVIESIIGKQTMICDGAKTYRIKDVESCDDLVWLSWRNSYGMIQYIPMTGDVSIVEDTDADIDFNQYDTQTNRYLPTTRRKDYVQTLDINTGFEPDMIAVRSLLESDFVTIHNNDFTLSSRCAVTCDDLSRAYNPTEPEALKLSVVLVSNNSFY